MNSIAHGMNKMLQKYRSLRFCLLIFLVISFVPLITVKFAANEVFDGYKSFPSMICTSPNKEDHSLDFLIMFHQEIPNLEPFKPLIIKKFVSFPIVHIRFNNSETRQHFFNNYNHKIYRIEHNRVLISSLHIISEYNAITGGTSTEIQDSTGASFLHELEIKGQRSKIGIIDTGISNNTGKFGTRFKGRKSFVSIANGYSDDILNPDDTWGHGTKVASIAAENTIGIAPEAELYSAKVIHSTSVTGAGGGGGEETTAGMLEAIEYLVNNSVDVINISLGQYHNLPTGLRDEVINFVSIIHNIVFTVSAGNSGTSLGDRGTLNNPATSLQCIAATASDISGTYIANFAAKGPKVDYSLKPDIAAPGDNTPWGDGTSFSAPIVAGGAALLIDYLKSENLSYSAATIKAALLAGARTLGKNIWEEGAGFINITRSLEVLNTTERINNTPDLVYLHPQKLPFDPYKILFNSSSVVFNLTVISSRMINTSINASESLSSFVNISNSFYKINNTTLIPINFTIPASAEAQFVSGYINISHQTLVVEFEIRETVTYVLFDESLNRIVKHGIGTNSYEIQGDTSSTIGMFSAFTEYLAYKHNYSVTPHIKGEMTLTQLLKYDVLILANPFSLATDVFMDWVENPGEEYVSMSANTVESISQFVSLGGGVLILSTDEADYNITTLNEFLVLFNLQIQTESAGSVLQSTIVNPQNFTTKIYSFPFYGNYIQTLGKNTQIIAEYNGNPTLASYEDPSGGKVLFYGSDLIFDNVGFSSNAYFGNSTENRILALNSVAWLAEAEGKYIQTATSVPEFPYPLVFLILIITMCIISILFINRTKN
ncbi:MAG: S8 family peptidase [Candidatus Hodarchaeales archaeon]|jgi:hypothetical protein